MNPNEINIYSQSEKLLAIMKSVEPIDGFTHKFYSLKSFTNLDTERENIFIINRLPEKLYAHSKYILCSRNPELLTTQQLGNLYDLWPEPLTPALVKFCFRKLQAKIKSDFDNNSEQLEYQKRILEMARQDYLTGLATRWYLQEYIETNKDEGNITCIYFDLDNFKYVNDTYGHQEGDRALAATAEMLQREFTDGFAARMGGDEFMIVLLGLRPVNDVAAKVDIFMSSLIEYYSGVETMKTLSVSAGISQKLSSETKSIDQLIHESDQALYEAKNSGRACCKIYDKSMK